MEPLNNQTPQNESQDEIQQTETPNNEPQPRPLITKDEKEGSVGPVIASIIIIILIIVAGLYFWGSILKERGYTPEEFVDPNNDPKVEELESQGSSDEIDEISDDLGNTNIDDLDSGLDDIDQAFEEN